MSSSVLVHVIDDDEDVRQSLDFLLGTAGMQVRTYESGAAFLAALPGIDSGCIVTDVRMPGISGIDLLRKLKGRGVALPVIVRTGHGDVALAVEAMKIGAADFLEKPVDDEALLGSIRSVLDRVATDTRRDAEVTALRERVETLSVREREVLEGLIAGFPNKTIAYDLGISPRTVEIYRANVMTKMKAASLSELVRMALIAGVTGSQKGR